MKIIKIKNKNYHVLWTFCILIMLFPDVTMASNNNTDLVNENQYYIAARKVHKIKKYRPRPKAPYPEIRTDYVSLGSGYYNYEGQADDLEATESGSYAQAVIKMQIKISYMLLSLSGDITRLDSKYKGYISTGQYVDGDIENINAGINYSMGFSYAFSPRFHMVFPYTGLYYRRWLKEGKPSHTKVDERYEWFNIPVGISLQVQLFRNFIMTINACGGPAIGGRATIFTVKNYETADEEELSEEEAPVPEGNYPIFKLKRGWFYRLEASFEYYINQYTGIEITPWYERVIIGEDKSTTINETEIISVSKLDIKKYGAYVAFKLYF